MSKDLGLSSALSKSTSVVDRIIATKFGSTPPVDVESTDESHMTGHMTSQSYDKLTDKSASNITGQQTDLPTNLQTDRPVSRPASKSAHRPVSKRTGQQTDHTTDLSAGQSVGQSVTLSIKERLQQEQAKQPKPIYDTVTFKVEVNRIRKINEHNRATGKLKQDILQDAIDLYFELIEGL